MNAAYGLRQLRKRKQQKTTLEKVVKSRRLSLETQPPTPQDEQNQPSTSAIVPQSPTSPDEQNQPSTSSIVPQSPTPQDQQNRTLSSANVPETSDESNGETDTEDDCEDVLLNAAPEKEKTLIPIPCAR